jgi:hypothetical protein
MVDLNSKQEAVEVLKKWLLEEGYDITSIPNETADYNFRITKTNMAINVGFHKRSEDHDSVKSFDQICYFIRF